MAQSRLSLALEEGLFSVPEGTLAVFGALAEADLSMFPRDRVRVVQTFRPDHDALSAAGFATGPEAPGHAEMSLVFLPRSKAAARATIAEASRITAGPVIIDGQKSDGVESVLRDLRRRADVGEALSKAHGKLAVLAPGADLGDWADPGPEVIEGGFVTRIGVFSADGIDPGSALLAAALPAKLGARVADMGAGWGYLSRTILERDSVRELHLIEADLRALECARRNVGDPRAVFHWADAATFRDGEGFDGIVTNPPFHEGRAATPDLGQSFIAAAAGLLRKGGQLWLVANRHLPYEKSLRLAFGEVGEIGGNRSYKVFRAARPIRTKG